jgi:hypothetical protein
MENQSLFGRVRVAACLSVVALMSGCLSAAAVEDPTSLRVTNVGADSVAIFAWALETAVRTTVSFAEPTRLSESMARQGVIAPGRSRDFPLDSIIGFRAGQSIRVEVLSVRRDTVRLGTRVDLTTDELRSRNYSVDVSTAR